MDPRATLSWVGQETTTGSSSADPDASVDPFDALQLVCQIIQEPEKYPGVDQPLALRDLITLCNLRDEYQCFAEAILFKDVRFYKCFETGQLDNRFDVIIHRPQVARQVRRLQLEARMLCTSTLGKCQDYDHQADGRDTSEGMGSGKERVHLLLMACRNKLDELFVVARDGHEQNMISDGTSCTSLEKSFLCSVLESLRHVSFPNLRELVFYLPMDLSCLSLFNSTMRSNVGHEHRNYFQRNLANLDHLYLYIGGSIQIPIMGDIFPLASATKNLVLRINDFKDWNKRYSWDMGNAIVPGPTGASLKHLEINKTMILGLGHFIVQLPNLTSLKVADCQLSLIFENWAGVFDACQTSPSLLYVTFRRNGYVDMGEGDGWTCNVWNQNRGADGKCNRAVCTTHKGDFSEYLSLQGNMRNKHNKRGSEGGLGSIGNGEDFTLVGWEACFHR